MNNREKAEFYAEAKRQAAKAAKPAGTQTCPDCNEPIIVGTPCETCARWNEQGEPKLEGIERSDVADCWTVKTPDGHLVHTVLALAPQDSIDDWLRTEAALNLLRNASLRARGLPGCRPTLSWEQFEAEGYSVVPVKIVLLPETHLQGLVHSMRPAQEGQNACPNCNTHRRLEWEPPNAWSRGFWIYGCDCEKSWGYGSTKELAKADYVKRAQRSGEVK